MKLSELITCPERNAFQDYWKNRPHKTTVSAVEKTDFPAYLRRNAPAGEITLTLFGITDHEPKLVYQGRIIRTSTGRSFEPLPDWETLMKENILIVCFTGTHEQMLTISLCDKHPQKPSMSEADRFTAH